MSISQRTVTDRAPGVHAAPVYPYPAENFDTVINASPQAEQVGTIVVDTATHSATYTVTIEGEAISYVADSATTKIEIAAGLAAAINATPAVRGVLSAASDGVDTVTLTGLIPGTVFTASDADAKLTTTAAVTAAADADAIAFGRFVVDSEGYFGVDGERYGALPTPATLAAQVDTLTVDYAAGEVYYVGITIEGRRYSVAVAADTDDATTATAIRAALNAILPANSVVVTGSTDQVIMTAEVEGKSFTTDVGLKSGTTARLSLAYTTATRDTDLTRCLAGFSLLALDEETIPLAGGTDEGYPANGGVRILRAGDVWVSTAQTPSAGDPVYVETAAGASAGKPYTDASATRIKLPTAIASWQRYNSTAGLAVLRLNLPVV